MASHVQDKRAPHDTIVQHHALAGICDSCIDELFVPAKKRGRKLVGLDRFSHCATSKTTHTQQCRPIPSRGGVRTTPRVLCILHCAYIKSMENGLTYTYHSVGSGLGRLLRCALPQLPPIRHHRTNWGVGAVTHSSSSRLCDWKEKSRFMC